MRLQKYFYVASFEFIYAFLLMLRLMDSIFCLPADPGYYIFQGGRQDSFRNLITLETDYIYFLERFVALIVLALPIELTALVSSLITSLIWVSTAIVITVITKKVTNATDLDQFGTMVFVNSSYLTIRFI